jgi:hypothetical protein
MSSFRTVSPTTGRLFGSLVRWSRCGRDIITSRRLRRLRSQGSRCWSGCHALMTTHEPPGSLEKELDARILAKRSWRRNGKRGFDPPERFTAYLGAIRWNCVNSTNPRLFRSPSRAGIDVTFYQLEPLRKALTLRRVNLFIADDVGFGKTIKA